MLNLFKTFFENRLIFSQISSLCLPSALEDLPLLALNISSEVLIIIAQYCLAFLLISRSITLSRQQLSPNLVVDTKGLEIPAHKTLSEVFCVLGLAGLMGGTTHLIHLFMQGHLLNSILCGTQGSMALILLYFIGRLTRLSYLSNSPVFSATEPFSNSLSSSESLIPFYPLEKPNLTFHKNLLRSSPIGDENQSFESLLTQNQQIEEILKLTQFSIDKAADAIFWVGQDGQIFYVNDAACRSLGYSPQELLNLTIHDINPDFPESSWSLHWTILRRCGSLNIEARHRTKHNRIFPVEIMINHLNFNGKEYECAFVRDISERKEIERSLRERQGEFRSLVANIPGAVYRGYFDTDRTMSFLSQGIELITGYPATDLIENRVRSFSSLIHPDDRQKVECKICKAVERKQPYILEYRLICEDGTLRWVYEKGQAIFADYQGDFYLNGAIFDITEKKKASEALKASEERLKLALAGTDQGLWDWNIITGDVYFSPQWSLMLGHDENRIQGHAKSWLKLVHPEDRDQVVEQLKQHLSGNTPFCEVEHRMLSRSGEWKWILNHGKVVVRDEQGEPLRMTGTVKDISDRKSAEQALRESESRERTKAQQLELTLQELGQAQAQLIQTEKLSSLGQMVAGIAHEINNPITFIYGNITYANQYLQDLLALIRLYQKYHPKPHPEIDQYQDFIDLEFIIDDLPKLLSSMESGADRIREIVLSLRNFSRLDESEMKPANIHEGLDNTLLILQHRLRNPNSNQRDKRLPQIQVIKEYGNLPKLECYPGQLNQVFMNVLNNAIDALYSRPESEVTTLQSLNHHTSDWQISSPLPTIWIRTAVQDANRVVIRITDNGSGMSEGIKRHLFEPFFTTKPVGKGTGLGLAISYQIIAKHQGRLYCNSELGQGTEFVIELPLKQELKIKSNPQLEMQAFS